MLGLIEQALAEAEVQAGAESEADTAPAGPSEALEEPDEDEAQAEDKGRR